MSEPGEQAPPPARTGGGGFVAGAMIAIGVLLVTLCGTCTLYFGGASLWSLLGGKDDASMGGVMLVTALVLGGIPTVGGLVLLLEGLKHFRRRRGEGGAPETRS